jgi:D-alanyl-D-alanine carboxypeptidase
VLDACDLMEKVTPYAKLSMKIKITPCAAHLVGTSAELVVGDSLTVEELLYGMMLPSGNDAAQSLALYFGVILMHNGQVEPNGYLSEVPA